MLLASLSDSSRYEALHPAFPRALAFLRQPGLAELPPGRHELEGDHLFALIQRPDAIGQQAAVLEAHRRYIDIQFAVSGIEVIGWRERWSCAHPRGAFDEARDVILYDDSPRVWIPVLPQFLAVLFPEDAHAPLAGEGPLHKVVLKVEVVR